MAFIGNTPTQQAFTPAVDFFNGNGSTTAFTLSRPVASVAQVQAVISNVPQKPGDAFTVSGNTITFTSAPPSGTQNIYVYYTSPITQVIAPGQGTVTSDSFGVITNFTTTGNTTLGDASTDTLNVGNGGLVKDSSGRVGIGQSTPAYLLDVNGTMRLGSAGSIQPLLLRSSVTGGLLVNNTASGGAGPLVVQDNGTEVLRVTDSLVVLKGGSTSATGTGIAFPATQSASSDANTLDDYEEGTWTPTFTASGYTFTQSSSVGVYTKIGRVVTWSTYVTVTYVSGSGTVVGTLTGLPFTASSSNANYGGIGICPDVGSAYLTSGGYGQMCGRVGPNSSSVYVFVGGGGLGLKTTFNWAGMSANTEFELSGTYITNT